MIRLLCGAVSEITAEEMITRMLDDSLPHIPLRVVRTYARGRAVCFPGCSQAKGIPGIT